VTFNNVLVETLPGSTDVQMCSAFGIGALLLLLLLCGAVDECNYRVEIQVDCRVSNVFQVTM